MLSIKPEVLVLGFIATEVTCIRLWFCSIDFRKLSRLLYFAGPHFRLTFTTRTPFREDGEVRVGPLLAVPVLKDICLMEY